MNAQIKWAAENGVDLPLNSDGTLDTIRLEEIYENLKPKKFASGKEVSDFFENSQSHKRWLQSLSDEDENLIRDYTDNGFRSINNYLRYGTEYNFKEKYGNGDAN